MRETMREMSRWEFYKSYTIMLRKESQKSQRLNRRDWKWKYRNQSLFKGKKNPICWMTHSLPSVTGVK